MQDVASSPVSYFYTSVDTIADLRAFYGEVAEDNCGICETQECGNGLVEAPEICDDGNTDNTDSCTDECLPNTPTTCGDGVVQPPEECDGAPV